MTALVHDITDGRGALIERLLEADDIERRRPVTWLNYPGDVTAGIVELLERSIPMGPNTIGEWLWPVSAAFDVETNRTRVGFSYVQPPAVAA